MIFAVVLNCSTQRRILSKYSFRTEVNKLGTDLYFTHYFDSVGQGIYGYNFEADSTYELSPPNRNYSIFKLQMGSKDSVLYFQRMANDSTRKLQLIKYDLTTNQTKVVFDRSLNSYGLAKNDSLLVYTSALAYGTSSPVNNVPMVYNQKVYLYNLFTKEFKRIGESLNYNHIEEFYVHSDLDLLFLSNYNSERISFFVDPKGYIKYDLKNDTYEYFINIRDNNKELVTQMYLFNGVYNGFEKDELIIEKSEYLIKYSFSKKVAHEFFNYENQKGIKSGDSYQINNVRPLVSQNGYLLSVINANTFELIYVIIDKNGTILREFLPDMSEFKTKYLPPKQINDKL